MTLEPGRFRKACASDRPEDRLARVWLAHRRLSVIDPAGSKQPLANEDGSVWVSFNGEIYNFEQLRRHLQARGHTLREQGDTEVLVHLWEAYAQDMLSHLTGMFAFAIYDSRRGTLFLARDRFGEKPLYYWPRPGFFAFASELQALKCIRGFPLDSLSSASVATFFRIGYIPSPDTIYSGVYSLPAGHYALLDGDGIRVSRYWRPQVRGTQAPVDDDELASLIDESVASRMRADVPLGALLSGGIDSSLIVSSMVKAGKDPIKTFTIKTGTDGSDESAQAALIAAHLGTDHRTYTVNTDLVAVAEQLARHYGQPYGDYSNVPTYYACRETRREVTVALTGDGGDELFAGYRRYANLRWSRRIGLLPMRLRRPLAAVLAAFAPRRADYAGHLKDFVLSAGTAKHKAQNPSTMFHNEWRPGAFSPDFHAAIAVQRETNIARLSDLFDQAESDDPLERWLEVDQQMYLSDDILPKVDIASMAVSLECRAPLLDHRLVERVNRIPISEKLAHGRTKLPLRRLAARRLPGGVAELPKRGFTLPLSEWLRGGLRQWAFDLIFNVKSGWDDYLEPRVIHRLWTEHERGSADHSMRLWLVVAWALWRNGDWRANY